MHERLAQTGTMRQVVLLLAPWAAFLVLSSLVLGPAGVIASAKNAWPQALAGVYPGFGGGAPLMERAVARLAVAMIPTLASFTVKLAAFNLLPLPALAGGQLLMLLFRLSTRAYNLLATLGTLLLLPFWLGWFVSFYRLLPE